MRPPSVHPERSEAQSKGRAAVPVAALLLVAPGCLSGQSFPGDEVMGTFSFEAEPTGRQCAIPDMPEGGFSFAGTFSRDRGHPGVWYTLGSESTGASFDGQVVEATRSAARRFPACGCGDHPQLRETLRVALISKSQDRELQGRCPEQPFDGGVPEADGGVLRPDSTEQGFDAVRACGELWDEVWSAPDAGCDVVCGGCRLVYRVRGVRR